MLVGAAAVGETLRDFFVLLTDVVEFKHEWNSETSSTHILQKSSEKETCNPRYDILLLPPVT